MKALLQRVTHANVVVDGTKISEIQQGLLVFVGLEKGDDATKIKKMTDKILNLRIFSDADDKMNLSVQDVHGEILLVSQFTLAASTQKGRRPSFDCAMPPQEAELFFQQFVDAMRALYPQIHTGKFAADMKISLLNDGPVTFLLEV